MATIPDEVRRLWDSVLVERSEAPDNSEYRSDNVIEGQSRFEAEFSDVADLIDDAIFSDLDPDWDDDVVSDNWHDDPAIEVALEGCPFDFDELADNMIDSGPEF